MADELDQLLDFLSNSSLQVRAAAADIVRGLTGDGDGLRFLTERADRALPALLRLLDSTGSGTGEAAAAADSLVNLSQDGDLAARLVSLGAVAVAMDVVVKRGGEQPKLARSLVMLLVNLTQVESGIAALLQAGDETVQGLYVAELVQLFCRASGVSKDLDNFEHVAFIFVNISKVEAGRILLMDPKSDHLEQIIRQFHSTNRIQKKGIAGVIHNCCYEADIQMQKLLSVAEYLWPALLLPVAGKKIYSEEDLLKMPTGLANALSHEREAVDDAEIRLAVLQATYMIVMQDHGRKAFWSVNGPRILQVGYEDEKDQKVIEAYQLIGSLLVCLGELEHHVDESDDVIALKLYEMIKENEVNFFEDWSNVMRRQFYESTLVRLSTPKRVMGNVHNIENSVIFDTTNMDNIQHAYLIAINQYRMWQLDGSDEVYEFSPEGRQIWGTRRNGTFVFWYRLMNADVGAVIDGQTGWVEGFLRRTIINNSFVYNSALQFSRTGGAVKETKKERKKLQTDPYIISSNVKTLDMDGRYLSVCDLDLIAGKLQSSILMISDHLPNDSFAACKSSSDRLILYCTEAGKNLWVFEFTMESLGPVLIPLRIPFSLEPTITKHDKISKNVRHAIAKFIEDTAPDGEKEFYEVVDRAPMRNLSQCVDCFLILKRDVCFPTKFFLLDREKEFYKQRRTKKIEKKPRQSTQGLEEKQCEENLKSGTLYREDSHGGATFSGDMLPEMPQKPSELKKWYHHPFGH